MKCPYCATQIDAEAIVCPQCRRDLFLLKPLQSRIEALDAALAEARDRIHALEVAVALSSAGGAAVSPAAAQDLVTPGMTGNLHVAPPDARPSSRKGSLGLWCAGLALLLAAHLFIVMLLDLHTIWLRVASLFIPLPLGYLLGRRADLPLRWNLLAAAGVAVLAVTGMSAVVASVDGTPVWPQDPRSWREFVQYAASIGLGFTTGLIVGNEWRRRAMSAAPSRTGWAGMLAGARALSPDALQKRIEMAQRLIVSLTAIGTTVASAVAGLRGLGG